MIPVDNDIEIINIDNTNDLVEFELPEVFLPVNWPSSGKAYALLMGLPRDSDISDYPVYNRNTALFFVLVKFSRLLCPLVSLDPSREEFNRFVDLIFDLWRHVTNLLESIDPKGVQLVGNKRTNSLDGL